MSGGFPISGRLANPQSVGASGASQATLTSAAAANTKGSWTQLVSATAYDAAAMWVQLTGAYNGGGSANLNAVDIGIGPAGSEIVLFGNLLVGQYQPSLTCLLPTNVLLPCSIPAGTRIAARSQSTQASYTCNCSFGLFEASFDYTAHSAKVDTLGFISGSTHGTALSNPSVAATKGPWTQLVAATSYDYASGYLFLDSLNAAPASYNINVDIAIGAAGSEKPIMTDFHAAYFNATNGGFNPAHTPLLNLAIPAGSRVSVRYAFDNAAGNVGATFYGIRQ